MRVRVYSLFLGLGLLMTILAGGHRAEATLGEPAASVEVDREALSANPTGTASRNGYTVQEVESDSCIIREYVSPSRVVFAIAWNGLIHPDLTQLLGSYAGEYEATLLQTPREPGRSRLRVKTNRVTVEKWGHMRNLQGRAYVPALIPRGVSIDEIK